MPKVSQEHGILTQHLFRQKYGEILAALCRTIGYKNLEIAEEATMDAFAAAVESWPYAGTPDNPPGWLYIVARNKAIDVLRKSQAGTVRWRDYMDGIIADTRSDFRPERSEEDILIMLCMCSSRAISPRAQLSVMLKCVSGFSVSEIARAVGSAEEAVKKTLTRAKQTLAQEDGALRGLDPQLIAERYPVILECLYSMFNEGYAASSGETRLRADLAEEAIRLTDFLAESELLPAHVRPEIYALLALMLLNAARFNARENSQGEQVLLKDQDRSLWNREWIAAGLIALQKSMDSIHPGIFHIEARIAAEHALSTTFADTHWEKIISLYEQLLLLKPTDSVHLAHAAATLFGRGPEAALAFLESGKFDLCETHGGIRYLYQCLLAQIAEEKADFMAATESWTHAILLAPTVADRNFVENRQKRAQNMSPNK